MIILQEHLPQVRDATEEENWGFTLWEFITGNWIYLLAILFILAVFFYARYNWRKRHEQ
ncbi:hypothetical protein [Zunongwangia sp. H14]|uniref:hypothetical protein n=1 Tax=Zunongwangia sp. H14 TaxID=3240792 RepID=UPI003569179C